MDTLHHARFVSAVLSTGGPLQPTTRLLGYVDLTQQMAAKYGRQMSPVSIFDLVAYRADVQIQNVETGAFEAGIGAGVQGNVNYVSPGSTRIRALLETRERWFNEVRETDSVNVNVQLARHRQFYPLYDDEMPETPYSSQTETAGGTMHKVVLIDRGVVANAWGVFDDWNARNPTWPAPTVTQDVIVPSDPRLYVFPASEIEEVLGYRAYSTSFASPTVLANEIWSGVANHAEWNVAPAGRAWPVLCGHLRIEIDEITPPAAALQDVTNFVVILDFYVSGWRPVGQPNKGIRSGRRR